MEQEPLVQQECDVTEDDGYYARALRLLHHPDCTHINAMWMAKIMREWDEVTSRIRKYAGKQ